MSIEDRFIIENSADSLAVNILKESLKTVARFVPAMAASGWKYAIETPQSIEEGRSYDPNTLFISEQELLKVHTGYSKAAMSAFLGAFYESMLSNQEKEQVKLYHDFKSNNKKWCRNPFISRAASKSAKAYFSESASAYLGGGKMRQKLQKKDPSICSFLAEMFGGKPVVESGNLESILNIHLLPIRPKGKDTAERVMYTADKHNARAILKFLYGKDEAVGNVQTLFVKKKQGMEVMQVIATLTETAPEKECKNDLETGVNCVRRSFYAKTAWEGEIREAIALELNNLCTDEKVPYVLCHGIIITGEVPGEDCNLLEVPNDQKYAFEYGKLGEFARIIGLEDRCRENIKMLRDRTMRHIDFGQAFQNDGNRSLGNLAMQVNTLPEPHYPHQKLGENTAKRAIRQNILKNIPKIKAILRCIDEETYRKIDAGYRYKLFYGEKSRTFNPRDVFLNYVRSNGWHDIERMIWS